MTIQIDFGGIGPKYDATSLPPGFSQKCENCEITGSVMRALNLSAAAQSQIDPATTFLYSMVPSAEVVAPETIENGINTGGTNPPTKVTGEVKNIFGLIDGGTPEWLDIISTVWSLEDKLGSYLETPHTQTTDDTLTIKSTVMTPSGFQVRVALVPIAVSVTADVPMAIRGPNFQIALKDADPGPDGLTPVAPDTFVYFPTHLNSGDVRVPEFSVPLKKNGVTIGILHLVGISGPVWNDDIQWATSATYPMGGAASSYTDPEFVLTFDCNWRPNATRIYQYRYAIRDSAGHELYPTEPSEKIIANAGEIPTLTMPRALAAGENGLLYRSEGDRYFLRKTFRHIGDPDDGNDEENAGHTFEDNGDPVNPDITLPPYGQYDQFGYAKTSDGLKSFLAGSALLGGIGAYRYNMAADSPKPARHGMAFSDIGRLHAIPQEWTRPLAKDVDIIATMQSGNSILAFTDSGALPGEVWAYYGSNPANMTERWLSSSHALLNIKGIGKLGDSVFWVCTQGIAVSNGGEPEVITKEYFTPLQWADLTPATMVLTTLENSILITNGTVAQGCAGTVAGLRFNLNERGTSKFVTTFTKLAASGRSDPAIIKSKKYVFDAPVFVDYGRIFYEGAEPTVWVSQNGGTMTQISSDVTGSIASGKAFPIGLGNSKAWEIEIHQASTSASNKVTRAEFYERNLIPAGQKTTIPGSQIPVPGDIWTKYEDADIPVVITVNMGNNAAATAKVTVKNRVGLSIGTVTCTNGKPTVLPFRTAPVYTDPAPPAAWEAAELWRFSITQTDGTELQQPLESYTVWTRRTADTGAGGFSASNPGGGLAPWREARYKPGKRVIAKSYRVVTLDGQPVTMNFYPTPGASAVTITGMVSGVWTAFPAEQVTELFELDFGDDDYRVAGIEYQYLEIVPQGEGQVEWFAPRGVPPGWLGEERETAIPTEYVSAIVAADSYPVTMTVTCDGVLRATIAVQSAAEFILEDDAVPVALNPCSRLSVAFSNNSIVRRVAIFPREVIPATTGFERRNRSNYMRLALDYQDKAAPAYAIIDAVSYAGPAAGGKIALTLKDMSTDLLLGSANVPIPNGQPYIIPRGITKAKLIEVTVASTYPIKGLAVIPSRRVQSAGVIHELYSDGQAAPNLDKVYDFPHVVDGGSVIVHATAGTVWLYVYRDGATAPTQIIPITVSGKEYALTQGAATADPAGFDDTGCIEFGLFDGSNPATAKPKYDTVTEVFIFAMPPTKCQNSGISVRQEEMQPNQLERVVCFEDTGSFVGVRVEADTFDGMTFSLTPQGGSAETPISITDNSVYRFRYDLPSVHKWVYNLAKAGLTHIHEFHLYGRVNMEFKNGVYFKSFSQNPDRLIGLRIQSHRNYAPRYVRVDASLYPVVVTCWRNGVAIATKSVESNGDPWLPEMPTCREMEFDVVPPTGGQVQYVAFSSNRGNLG